MLSGSDHLPFDGGAGIEQGNADAAADATDAASDADAGAAALDASDACPPLVNVSDFYVDHDADAGACDTFGTIAAALQAAQASSSKQRTIHLSDGTYSATTGESFPIELRGGISISGAGQGSIVTGAGAVSTAPPQNLLGNLSTTNALTATFLVGETDATTSISNLSIQAPPGSNSGLEAIICDRGNGASPPPSPNTIIDAVTIAGFEASIRVTWSSEDPGVFSGCNALVRSSTLTKGAFGVVADGLLGSGGSPTQWVSVRLGDSASDGNKLLDFEYNYGAIRIAGAGLAIADAVAGAIVRGNTFAAEPGFSADFGVWAIQQTYDPTGLDIEDNTFGPLSNGGISLGGNVAVARLVNNTIQGVTMKNELGVQWNGIGLILGAWGVEGTPFVARARNNRFIGNDHGVVFRSNQSPLPTDPSKQSDFGTASSPGGNSFHCNSTVSGLPYPGGDVAVDLTLTGPPNVVLPFVGNEWDHAPPTGNISDQIAYIPNGVDVYEHGYDAGADGAPPQPLAAGIDVSDASTVPYTCPPGLVAGP